MIQASPPSRILVATLLGAVAMLVPAPPGQAGTLYGFSDVFQQVYAIDTATGAATLVGSLPPGWLLGGIAFDGDGDLHGVTYLFTTSGEMEFWELDPGAGTFSFVAATGSTCIEGGLTYDPTADVFYSKWGGFGGGTTQELITIDPATGVGTLVGNMGLDTMSDVSGMALLPDGTLLGYDPATFDPSRLVEIDTTTGLATVVGSGDIGDILFGSGLGGLAYDPDTDVLYMSNATELWTIDPTTGVGTLIGPHGLPDLITSLAVRPDACMIGLDLTSALFDVDAASGAVSNTRALGGSKFGGLAMNEFGELFGTHTAPTPELYSIDVVTGLATLIGPLGILHDEGGLDFDPVSGDLFGVGGVSELFQVDTTTGAATIVGTLEDEFTNPIDPSAMAFDEDGDLFVLKAASAPPEIYEVDPADATVLARVPLPGLPLAFHAGMEFDDATGILYLTYGNVLYRADPSTGVTVLVGPTSAGSALEIVGDCGLPPLSLTGEVAVRPGAAVGTPAQPRTQ